MSEGRMEGAQVDLWHEEPAARQNLAIPGQTWNDRIVGFGRSGVHAQNQATGTSGKEGEGQGEGALVCGVLRVIAIRGSALHTC